jgi:hypothetical protein
VAIGAPSRQGSIGVDQQLVYRKTALGEEAIQSRLRLSEHELRVILIMVDGKKTVGDIIAKFGNLSSVEGSLYRLEREGFIEPSAGHTSEIELERSSTQLKAMLARAEAARPALPAAGGFIPQPAPGAHPEDAVGAEALFRPASAAPQPAPATPFVIPPMPADEAFVAGEKQARAVADRAPGPQQPVAASSARVPSPSSWDEEDDSPADAALPPLLDDEPGSRRAALLAAAGPLSRPQPEGQSARTNPFASSGPATKGGFEAVRSELQEEATAPREAVLPFQFPRRRKGWGKLLLAFVVVLLAAPVLGFLAYPFDSHRDGLAAELSATMGQPVTIARLRATLSPSPAFILDELKAGSAGEISVREIRATPDLLSLFSERKRFSEVRVHDVRVPIERLGALSAAMGGVGASRTLALRRLVFSRVNLVARDLVLADYTGRAELDDGGRLRLLSLVNSDGTLRISVVGDGGGDAQVLAEGTGWKPSPTSPFVFEAIQVSGRISGSEFVTERIEGRLFGGTVNGRMRFAWGERMTLETDVGSAFMNTPVLLTALGVPAIVEGQLDGHVRFAVAAENWSRLVASVPMEGDFSASKGNLLGMDLVESVRRAGQQAYRGGSTKFDDLQGRFAWDGKALRLSRIELASGIVRASGAVRISREQQLDGDVEVVIRTSASRTREPVRISGTLREPLLTAGR